MEEPQLISFLKSEGETILEQDISDLSVHFCTGLAKEINQSGTHHLVLQYKCLLKIFTSLGNTDSRVIQAALQCLNEAIQKLTQEFKEDGENIKDLPREKKQYLRKSLVVAIFLIYKSFHELEAQVSNDKQNVTITDAAQVTKRRGKKKAAPVTKDRGRYEFWNSVKAKITSSLVKTLACSWEHLWPEGNNAFVYMRCLTIAYCDVLKNGGEDEDMFNILGVLSSRANEEKSVVGRLIPMVKSSESENMAKTLSHCFNYIEGNFVRGTIVESAIMEASNVYFAQLGKTDAAIERGFAALITELSLLNPQQMINCLPSLVSFLEAESSTVRSAVLAAGCTIISWHKSQPEDVNAHAGNENRIGNVLPILLNHTKDVNANVRSKALQLINKLINNRDVEGQDITYCMEAGIKRLLDKGVSVRKHAIQLMITIVTKHPLIVKFTTRNLRKHIREQRISVHEMLAKDAESKYQMVEIVVGEFIDNLDESLEYILDTLKHKIKDSNEGVEMIDAAIKAGQYWEACEMLYYVHKKFSDIPMIESDDGQLEKRLYMKYFFQILERMFPEDKPMDLDCSQNFENMTESEKVLKKKVYIDYLKILEDMSVMMDGVMKTMTIILDKGAQGDKNEVISFFSELAVFGYQPTKQLTISAVEALSQCKEIDTQMLNKFCQLFLSDTTIDENTRPVKTNLVVVKKLMGIVEMLSSQRENIIPLAHLMKEENILDISCIELLWDAFTLSTPVWEPKDSISAIYLLGVLGQKENKIITTNMNRIVDTGLGPRGLEDFNLAKSSCEALLFGCKKPKQDDEEFEDTLRYAVTDPLFDKLLAVIEKGLREKGNNTLDENFCTVAELSIQLIYKQCVNPKEVIQRLLNNLYEWVFGDGENASQIKDTERLAIRYLGVCTSLLGCELLFLETTVTYEVKKRRNLILKNEDKSKKGRKKKDSKNLSRITNSSIRNSSRISKSSINESAMEANELDQITGANGNFENDLDNIKKYTYSMFESGLYRTFRIHTFMYCTKINVYKSLRLKIACVKALAKIMSVFEGAVVACADNFNRLWDDVDHPMVKVEILRSAILLNQRFPNQMEKCTRCITQGLKDKNPSVKQAALDFITYLTLNDLLKARGQLTETAVLVADSNINVREMAKDFLKECATKDNVLLNAVPDIIARLNKDVSQETFQVIVKFVLGLIKAEKQTSGLVEKLLSRFTIIEKDPAKIYRNIAFCLTQCPMNEKSFKAVGEKLSTYSDKLDDDFIHQCFVDIIKDARKTCKVETKGKIDEYEKELKDARDKCMEAKRIEDVAAGRGTQTPTQSSEDESDESPNENPGSDNEQEQPQQNGTSQSGDENINERPESGDEEMDMNPASGQDPQEKENSPARDEGEDADGVIEDDRSASTEDEEASSEEE